MTWDGVGTEYGENRCTKQGDILMVRTTSIVLLMFASLAAVAAFRSGAGAQEDPPQVQERKKAQPGPDRADMMMQCPMMAGLEGIDLFADSPAVLQAQKDDLKLTEQPIEQLQQIEQTARRQARELLTEQQQEKLQNSPKAPLSMMELCMMRMPKTGKQPEQMCPMCMRMMRMRDQQQNGKDAIKQ